MNRKPLVSVITPSYNQGRFIRSTIESVLSQTYDNIEYIVIDGGSTDNTLEILEEFRDKLHWISEKDSGQSNAINKGFSMAKGEIVAWLNSDDVYLPHAVEKAVESLLKEDFSFVYGRGYSIDEVGEVISEFHATIFFDFYYLTHCWDYILQPTAFFSAKHLAEVGYLNEGLHYVMDWDLMIRLALASKVGFVDTYIAGSREYGDTKTSMGGLKRFLEIWRLLRRYSGKNFPPGFYIYLGSTIHSYLERKGIFDKKFKKFLEQYVLGLLMKNDILHIGRNVPPLSHVLICRNYSEIILGFKRQPGNNEKHTITVYKGKGFFGKHIIDNDDEYTISLKPDENKEFTLYRLRHESDEELTVTMKETR
jgi:glycosyltransferase involved in cell wall biosynthesis